MALIQCPECNKNISETAKVCLKCGFGLTPEIVVAQKKKKKVAQIIAVSMVVAVVIFFIMCSGVLNHSENATTQNLGYASQQVKETIKVKFKQEIFEEVALQGGTAVLVNDLAAYWVNGSTVYALNGLAASYSSGIPYGPPGMGVLDVKKALGRYNRGVKGSDPKTISEDAVQSQDSWRTDMRILIAHLCKVQHCIDESKAVHVDPNWPSDVRKAYEESCLAKQELEVVIPPLKKAIQRFIDGETSQEAKAECESLEARYIRLSKKVIEMGNVVSEKLAPIAAAEEVQAAERARAAKRRTRSWTDEYGNTMRESEEQATFDRLRRRIESDHGPLMYPEGGQRDWSKGSREPSQKIWGYEIPLDSKERRQYFGDMKAENAGLVRELIKEGLTSP